MDLVDGVAVGYRLTTAAGWLLFILSSPWSYGSSDPASQWTRVFYLGGIMSRVVFFVDGFNVYHSLKKPKYSRYLWLNYRRLATCYLTSKDTLEDVFYFTAIATWLPGPSARHRSLIGALESVGVKPVYGRFKEKDRYCPRCRSSFVGHEEKETDVNLAIYLYHHACQDSYDKAVLVTGDTDLVPAIKLVKNTFPNKEIRVLFPIGRWSTELKAVADGTFRTTEKQLSSSQLPDSVTLPSGHVVTRPANWI